MAVSKHKRLTVGGLRALKGRRQLTMLFVETLDEAAAAAAAGIDILSIVEPVWSAAMREAAGDCFVQVGLIYGQHCTYEDYLRAAHAGLMTGGDAFYCAGSLETIGKLAAEGIPVVGHVGLIPARATWTGGFKAVGRTAPEAMRVYRHVKALEAAGAVGAEIEVVPARVATEISKRTSLILMSMARAQAATRNICSPRTCSAARAGISPATPRSTATSAPNSTGCGTSASRPSRNSAPTSRPASIRRKSTSCRSPTPSSRRL
jgi:3-methyl-2-oxobutanoate hydroxymethyltransferase